MIAIRTYTTPMGNRKRVAEGEVDSCLHRIDFHFDIGGCRITDEDLEIFEREAEDRSKSMIPEGWHSGELCCLTHSPVARKEREFYGWWSVNWENRQP